MAVYTETIKLEDKVSPEAAKAANSVNILNKAILSTENALVKASATGNIKQYQNLTKNLDAYKAQLSTLPQITEKASESTQNFSQSTMGLQEELATATGGLSLIAEAAAALALVFGIVAIAGAKMAIEASTAKAQMISMFDALGAGVTTGVEVDDMLDDMRNKLGVTKDAMVPLVKEFMSMGITGKEAIEKMTTAALSAKALVGGAESGAHAFTELSKKIQIAAETGQGLKIPAKGLKELYEMGLTVDDIAKKMGISAAELSKQLAAGTVNAGKFGNALQDALIEKGAGPLEKMGLSTANLGSMFKEYIGDMFEDMQKPVYEFLAQIKDLFQIFSQAKPSGQAMKTGIQSVFTNILQTATKLIPMIKHFFLQMIIYALQAYIALKPIVQWFKDLRNNEIFMNVMTKAFEGLKVVAVALLVAVGAVVGIFLVLTAIGVAVGAGIWALAGIISTFVADAAIALFNWAASAVSAASQFIMGLVNGITSGAGMVIDAVKNLGTSAINSFKSVLGIASPSKVGVEMGGFFGKGVAQGAENEVPTVATASASLGGAAASGAASGAASSGGGSGSGVSVTVEAGAIQISGGSQQSISELTEQAVSLIFERVALAQGL